LGCGDFSTVVQGLAARVAGELYFGLTMSRTNARAVCAMFLWSLCAPSANSQLAVAADVSPASGSPTRVLETPQSAAVPPGAPQGFGAYPKPKNSWSIVFYWLPNPESDIDHYELDVTGDPCQSLKQYLCGIYSSSGTQTTYTYNNQNLGVYFWYQFRLRAVNTEGQAGPWSQSLYFTSTDVQSESALPDGLHLTGNYPNPFNASTRINYVLDRAADIELAVFDALGRRVTTLAKGPQAAGPHEVDWHGTDRHGRTVSSGVYYCRLTANEMTVAGRMLLLK
jgi:hypothetical protein